MLLNTTFVGSQSYISPPSFMFVSAAVSEIRELNQNKKKEENSEIGYFQFNTFPEHIIELFFNQSLWCTGLKEIEGLTKELCFAEGRPVFKQTFRFNVYAVYLF